MGVNCAGDTRAAEAGASTPLRKARDPERDFLCGAQWLFLADVAARSAALEDCLLLFHDVAARGSLGRIARKLARLYPAGPRKKKAPTAAILDAQSVKTSNHPGVRGYDAGKKVLGRKRHLVVDTLGLILGVLVTPASVTDRQGAAQLLPAVLLRHGGLRQLWADGGYSGASWFEPLQRLLPRRGLRLEIVKRSDGARGGFRVQPKRWIVERSFAWLTHARRLVKDYETKIENSTAFILIAASRLMLRRLASTF